VTYLTTILFLYHYSEYIRIIGRNTLVKILQIQHKFKIDNFGRLIHFRKLFTCLIISVHTLTHVPAHLIAYGLRKVQNALQFRRYCAGG
jgi:hypothetical protein